MGATRRNLQAQPKILKKMLETLYQPIQMKIFPKKSIFSTLKVLRSQKFLWGLPDRVCRLNPKSEKNYQDIISTNPNESFLKKKERW
jgi:hypothetical protein